MTDHVRMGIDKNSTLHLEWWEQEFGWLDPQSECEEIKISWKYAKALRMFFSKEAVIALDEINDKYLEEGNNEPEGDYEEGRRHALKECFDICQDFFRKHALEFDKK